MSRRQLILLFSVLAAGGITSWKVAAADGGADDFDAFAKPLITAVDSRLKDKKPSDATRQLFSSKDHIKKKYVRNTNLWCADLVPQLTGCAVWKPPVEYVGERYGGVMITSRHILFCKHAHPAWDGGWMKVKPQIIRFVKADNKVVDMTLIANADSPTDDLCVGLLNEDVPEGIHVVPLMPAISKEQLKRMMTLHVPDLSISQAGTRPNGQSHEAVVYPSVGTSIGPAPAPAVARKAWNYEVYPGDSGTPRFYVTPRGLALFSLTGAAHVSGRLSDLKTLIAACDESAIARGVLKKPTGKVPTVIDITIPVE